jgi:NAD(P)-dependent dehydrogenase (short-subunit alcohol dehydrogenase family)
MSTSSKPIALILGAGPRVGLAITHSLSSLGYSIATASRSGTNTLSPSTGILSLSADFSTPSCIPSLFTRVVETFGSSPSVIVWNAAALTPPPVSGSLFSVPVEAFEKDLNINTISAYVAAQEAVKGWESMKEEEEGRKVFIYTGNILNRQILPVPMMLTLGVGKSASAHWVGLADVLYKGKGWRYVVLPRIPSSLFLSYLLLLLLLLLLPGSFECTAVLLLPGKNGC